MHCEADEEDIHTPSVTLQHLRQLSLKFCILEPFIWTYLTAPNLVELAVTRLSDDYTDWRQEKFMAFRARSGFPLLHLVPGFDFSSQVDDIVQILETCPELRYLELRWTQLYDAANEDIWRPLVHLARHPACPLFLSNLRGIHIDATEESAGRQPSEAPLRQIKLYAEEPFDKKTLFEAEIRAF